MSFVNHLADVIDLRNRYFAVRHGESEANLAHLISSHPEIGTTSHGLSAHGQVQVAKNTKIFLANHPSTDAYVIISSDFRRARETADILAAHLSNVDVQLDKRLRERFFGNYDGRSDENYELIWQNDGDNPQRNVDDQVEPVESVRQRTTALVKELDDKYNNRTIFLVSHGDSLQILQTAFERMSNANEQRRLQHLERAEFRPLILRRKEE